ncbi:MAG: fibronectin type III domain-containing protein, partial [Sediminibacterium sp.]|nr:fibronectin type III domain-containing protein [Sediminibacterium sp.]
YYVASRDTSFNRTCNSVRVPVAVKINAVPNQPAPLKVILRNTLNTNQTLATISINNELFRVNGINDTPQSYILYAVLNETPFTTIRIDSINRTNNSRFDSLVSRPADVYVAPGITYNLVSLGLLERRPYKFYARGYNNINGYSPVGLAALNLNNDSIFYRYSNRIQSYYSTSFQINGPASPTSNNTLTARLPGLPNPIGTYTLEFWYKNNYATIPGGNATQPNASPHLIDFGDGLSQGGNSSKVLIAYGGDRYYWRSNVGDLASGTNFNSGRYASLNQPGFSINNWNHYALTFAPPNTLNFYVNGFLVPADLTNFGAVEIANLNNTNNNFLGLNSFSPANSPAIGEYREFRFWNQMRTVNQIIDNMFVSGSTTPTSANLLSWNPFGNVINTRVTSAPIANNSTTPYLINTNGTANGAANFLFNIPDGSASRSQFYYGDRRIFITHRTLNTGENVFVSEDNGSTWRQASNFGRFGIDKTDSIMKNNGLLKVRIYALSTVNTSDIPNYIDTFPDFTIITVPNSPSITGWSANGRSATITFTPPTDSGGVSINRYSLYARGVTAQGVVDATPLRVNLNNPSLSARTITISNLDTGKTYTFKLTATNTISESDSSAGNPTLKIYDSTVARIEFCQNTPVLFLSTKDNNLRFIIRATVLDGGSNIGDITGIVSQRRDTVITLSSIAVG